MLRSLYRASLFLCILLVSSVTLSYAGNETMLIAPPFSLVSISPDGSKVATFHNGGKDKTRVWVINTKTNKVSKFSISDGKGGQATVTSLNWIGSDTLAAGGKIEDDTWLYTYKIGDKRPTRLTNEGTFEFLRTIDGTKHFLVTHIVKNKDETTSCRLLEYAAGSDAEPKELYQSSSDTFRCLVDAKGRLRMVLRKTDDGTKTAWFAVDADNGEEKQVHAVHEWSNLEGIVGNSNKAILKGQMSTVLPSVYIYDSKSDGIVQTLADHPDLSVDTYGTSAFDRASGEVLGLHLDFLERLTHWIDPEMAKLQQTIDEKLIGSSNRIASWSNDKQHLLIERFIPVLPNQFVYYNVKKGSVSPLLINGLSLKPQEAPKNQMIRIPNRDGQQLTAVMTIPKNRPQGKMPLLVWINSGIWNGLERAEWNPEAAFFAAEGFVVLRINYTGRDGVIGALSSKHDSKDGVLKTFWDIEDSVKTLVDAGLVDPQKICIGGERQGGWAAAYAPIASPGLYKSVLSINGLYNLSGYREASKGENKMNASMELEFAKHDSNLSDEDVLALSVSQNVKNYPKTVFVTSGKWSDQEYKDHQSSYTKALKKNKVSVKSFSDEWWGPDLRGGKRTQAFLRAAAVLKASVK